MPDLRKLHDFMSRTQKHLQAALDNGDEQAVNAYEQMLDRANAVGERALSGGVVSGQQPIGVGGQEAASQPPQAQQQPTPSQPQQGLVPPSGQGKSVVDLQSLQKPSGLKLDLEQEAGPVSSPFSQQKPVNPIQGAMDKYGAKPPSSLSTQPAPPPNTSPLVPAGLEGGLYGSDVSVQKGQDPSSYLNLKPGVPEFLTVTKAQPSSKWSPPPWLSELSGENDEAVYSLIKNLSPDKKQAAINNYFTMAKEDLRANPFMGQGQEEERPEPPITGEPEVMPKEWDINPSLRARYDNLPGWTPEQQAAHAKEFDRKAEFEKRVSEEYGKAPSFIEQLLAMLLGGMRGLGQIGQSKQRYQAGRAAIGKEMRQERASGERMAYQKNLNQLKLDLEGKKAGGAVLGKAVALAMKPHLAEADAAQREIDTILRIPGVAESDPRIVQLKAQMAAALTEADNIVQSNLYGKGILK